MRPARCAVVQTDASIPPDDLEFDGLSGSEAVPAGLRAAQRWQDVSSYLTSLVLHLVCFLLITSVTVPWAMSASGAGAQGSLSLTMEFGQDDGAPNEVEVVTPTSPDTPEPAHTPNPSESTNDEAQGDHALEVEPAPRPTAPRPRAVRTGQQQRSAAKSQPSSQFQQWLQHHLEEPAPAPSSSRYAAILNRVRTSERPPTVPPNSATMAVAMTPIEDPQQRVYDRVVDGFIAYDIGQLRGTEGQRARREFMQLGPEAIPAIVRGLNKAAEIHASCPVGVLAGKLIQTLRQTRDSSLTQYALDQLGRDVSSDAPHFRRLMALRQRWLGSAGETPDQVASLVARQALDNDGDLLELVLALTDAPSDTLVAALESGDKRLCNATLIALTRSSVASLGQRRRLISVIRRLVDDPADPPQRALAQEALRVLQGRP